MLGAGYLFWFLFGGEMYLVLLTNQKDYEHTKRDEANMVTQKTWDEASMVKNRIKNVEYLRQNLWVKCVGGISFVDGN